MKAHGNKIKRSIEYCKSPIFRKEIISYFCVLLIPVFLLGGTLSYASKMTVRAKLNDINHAAMKAVCMEIEKRINEFQRLASYFDLLNEVKEMLNVSYSDLKNDDYLSLNTISKNISVQTTTDGQYYSLVYIYFPESDIYVEANSSQRMYYGFKKLHPNMEGNGETWTNTLKSLHGVSTTLIGDHHEVYAVRGLPIFGNKKSAYIVARMEMSGILNAAEPILRYDGTIGILQNNELIYQVGAEDLAGNTNAVEQENSKFGVSVIAKITDTSLMESLYHIARIGLWALLICLHIGLIVTIYFSYRHYNPIYDLANMVQIPEEKNRTDEYGSIRAALLVAENERHEFEITKIRCQLEENERLIHESTDLFHHAEKFRILRFLFLAAGRDDAQVIASSACTKLIQELCTDSISIIPQIKMITVFCPETTNEVKIREHVQQIIDVMRERYGSELAVIIGEVENDYSTAMKKTEQAQKYYLEFSNDVHVIFCRDIPNDEKPADALNVIAQYAREIGAMLRLSEYHQAYVRLEDVQRRIGRLAAPLQYAARATVFAEITTAVMQMDIENGIDILSRLRKLFETEGDLTHMIDEIHQGNSDCRIDGAVQAITHIIETEYYQQQMSVGHIADRLGMPIDSVSRLFKKARGIGALEYIHMVRISEAKKRLLENEDSIADISLHVGYTSPEAFIRAFKRIEGTTPGKFRKDYSISPQQKFTV